ncbi:MAG: hypothetical protein KJO60_13315 [Desulfofustis sp.]|nr:hypothetical protein [Desulfofustis sp.]NNK55771.1 hypothetical protein [Desulfofustis sp.]
MKLTTAFVLLVACLPVSAGAYPRDGRVMRDHLNLYFQRDTEATTAMLDARVTVGYVTSFFETLRYERRICLSNQRGWGGNTLLSTKRYLDENPESLDLKPQEVLRLVADEYYSCEGSASTPADDLELTSIDSQGSELDIEYRSTKVMRIKCSVFDREGDLITWERVTVGEQQQEKGSFIIQMGGARLWEYVECVLPDGQFASISRPKG